MSPAGEAVRVILREQLGAMQANEAGMIADRDPEDLHLFRVALRRTRSCIGQMKRSLPPEPIERFKPEFAWLGSVTGPARDLDVFLDDITRYRRKLDKMSRPDLEPLIELVRADKRRERERLVAELDADRYRSLIAGWQIFLDAPFDREDAPQAGLPIADVAAEKIRSLYERMIRRGRRLNARKDTDRLHRLRIDGKKLRYLLEFFRDAFPAETIEPLIVTLKRLQDHLGRFNDLRVQQIAVVSMVDRLESTQPTPVSTFVAVGRVLEQLADKEQRVRRRFSAEFGRFDSEDTARRIPVLGSGVSP